ncbi:MAG TPA: allophanate hydrolase, partial [Enterobacter sp.]|nr:allophanate hydrolase [Enterobacter sp.]
FVPCTLEEALEARRIQKQYIEQLAWRLHDRG